MGLVFSSAQSRIVRCQITASDVVSLIDMPNIEQDTIVAVATPVGRGGIGVVRVSGPRAREVVTPLLRLRHELAAGRARFAEILDVSGATPHVSESSPFDKLRAGDGAPTAVEGTAVLDEAVVTYFAAPNSYTGEDVVEIAAHGAPVLLEYLVRACCAGGARLAEPGEFTQRAFLAGRIDLTQAEAVDDLIGSSTLEQVSAPKELLVGLIAAMEAGIDFAEDDIDILPAQEIAGKILEVRGPLAELERSFAYGRVVREGFTLAIVGRPNVGKSSLFNRLVERERAIVTATPGTTRDTVAERVSMAGIPVELIDTAGLREATDEAERMGIARSREAMAEAGVVLLVIDALVGIGEEEREVLEGMGGRGAILVWNKWDLVAGEGEMGHVEIAAAAETQISKSRCGAPEFVAVRTSALMGEGIEEVRAAIVEAVVGGGVREGGMLTNLRQHGAVVEAVRGLDAGMDAVRAGIPHEMVLLDLYGALRGLDALTGATTNEDVLRLIFSRFCIGK